MFSKTLLTALTSAMFFIAVIGAPKAAQLHLPSSLQVLTVDGQPMAYPFAELLLDQGKHLLVLRYRDLFADNADDSGTWVTSAPLYLRLDLQTPKPLSLQLPQIDDADAARAYLRQPFVNTQTADGEMTRFNLQPESAVIAQLLLANH
ncbi:DUF2057 family protein [Shewanella sp. YIC-542]|uniref:DUF2057 family protein n=1 Tax=Shewanella mytili TaxID=3377111 RepID=UPI00398F603B